jgi:hypothetical protein
MDERDVEALITTIVYVPIGPLTAILFIWMGQHILTTASPGQLSFIGMLMIFVFSVYVPLFKCAEIYNEQKPLTLSQIAETVWEKEIKKIMTKNQCSYSDAEKILMERIEKTIDPY